MKIGLWVAAGLVAVAASLAALAQNAAVNPIPGSIWTYLGATYGAGWVPPQQFASSCKNILAYGGVGDNVVDNGPAFVAASGAGGCIFFPPGQYYFSSAHTLSVPSGKSILIQGSGMEISLLRFPSGVNGFNIELNDRTATFHVRDLSFLAGGPPQQPGNALFIKQMVPEIGSIAKQSDVTNVTFRGSDGYFLTNGWQGGVSILDVTNINFINDAFFGTLAAYNGAETQGVGIYAVGYPGNTTQVAAQFNVIASTFEALNIGIGYDYNVQGFAISNSTFVLNNIGVFSNPTALQKGALQFIGNNCNNFIACVQDSTIDGIPFAIYSGNVIFLQTNSVGIQFVGNNTIVSDNTIWGALGASPNSIGIYAAYGSATGPTIIHDNIIKGVTGGATMGVGIKLDAFSQSIVVHGNMIDPGTVTVPIQNNSTFGNHNFITGQPTNIAAQVVTGAASNVKTGSHSVSAATPSIVSWAAHGLPAGASFKFGGVGSLTGITAGPTYYVSGGANYTANSFAYSASFAGPDVNTTGTTSSVTLSTTPELTRLTVPTTAGFVTGAYASINGLVGVACNYITPVWVADATHLDLSTCLWGAGFAYTGGGMISTLP